MRIWQRSAIASTRCPLVSEIRSTSDMAGTTECRSGRAVTGSKARSAISGSPGQRSRAGADVVEEGRDGFPCRRPAVEAAPVPPHPAGQRVARVNGDEEAVDAVLRPDHQDRLDVVG